MYVCSSESSSLIVFVIGGFSQFGINTNRCCYVCLYVNAFIRVCVCVSVDIALKLLLYRTSTEKHNETVRQTAGVGYCCCLLCMRMKSAAFDIDYRNTLCAWIYVHLYLNIHTYIHTVCMFVICLCFVVAFYICATARCCLFHLFTVIVLLPDHE